VFLMRIWFSVKLCAELLRDGLVGDRELHEHEAGVVGHPVFGGFLRQLKGGELPDQQSRLASFNTAFFEKMKTDGTMEFFEKIHKGGMSKLKEIGLYADVNDDTGEVVNDPASVTKKDAAFWITQASLSWMFTLAKTGGNQFLALAQSLKEETSGIESALQFFKDSVKPAPATDAPPRK